MDKEFRKIYKINQLEFWKNVWFYHKKIIIGVLLILIAFIYFIVSCSQIVRPDISVLLVTKTGIAKKAMEETELFFSEKVPDINQDGARVLYLLPITVAESNAEVEWGVANQLNTEIINGDSDIVIGEKNALTEFFQLEDFWEDISGIQTENSETEIERIGNATAIHISHTNFARQLGYQGEELLLLLRKEPVSADSESRLRHQAALALIKQLTE